MNTPQGTPLQTRFDRFWDSIPQESVDHYRKSVEAYIGCRAQYAPSKLIYTPSRVTSATEATDAQGETETPL